MNIIPGKLYKSLQRIYTIGGVGSIQKYDIFMVISHNVKYMDEYKESIHRFIVSTKNGTAEFGIAVGLNIQNYIEEL